MPDLERHYDHGLEGQDQHLHVVSYRLLPVAFLWRNAGVSKAAVGEILALKVKLDERL